ncbi:MAG: ATPase, T2SS/T4P/T4SS family, partial [Deltaproteobacteria bacterium]|nr:ATPase, T2SS/T4P/T4SS family [Deltaproteobacteria bacterium]
LKSGVEVSIKTAMNTTSKSTELLSEESYSKILNILKVLSNLNFATSAPYLEGSFRLTLFGNQYSFRVSIVSTLHGKTTTIRQLSRSEMLDLTELTPIKSQISILLELLKQPGKLKFIAGPMGSGKTTLLYAVLKQFAKTNFVITIEDPPEIDLEEICQIPVRKDFDYACALKAVLRHNPDHIALGELRDSQTLKTAEQACALGHSILATIHAGDLEAFRTRIEALSGNWDLLKPNITCVVFTRLYPKICQKCRIVDLKNSELENKTLFTSPGCERCSFTGVVGKILIFEIYSGGSSFQLEGLSFKEQCASLARKGLIRIA